MEIGAQSPTDRTIWNAADSSTGSVLVPVTPLKLAIIQRKLPAETLADTLRGFGVVAPSDLSRKLQVRALNSLMLQVFAGTRYTPMMLVGKVQSMLKSSLPAWGTETESL